MPFPFLAGRRAADARKRTGIHIQRIGGRAVWTPAANLPSVGAVLALRCFAIFARPRVAVILRLDGRFLRRVPLDPPARLPDGRGRQLCNCWLDLSDLPLGRHRITVEPIGPFAWLFRRGRVFMRVADGFHPDSDASLPPDLGPDLTAAVAALPSVVRPARRSPLPDPVRSILVVRADQLGDLVVSLPAMERLRRLFPHARLTLIATAGNADLARATGLFEEVLTVSLDEGGADLRLMAPEAQAALAERLASARFDLGVDLGEGPRSRLLLLLSGARFTYGFRHGDHHWLSAGFELNGRDPADALEVIPPARKILALVEALGAMQPRAGGPALPPPDPALLARHGLAPNQRFLVVHAGARLAYSRWPHVAALVRLLLARTELPLLLFGSVEQVPPDLPAAHAGRLRLIEGLLPFAEFDALLGGAAVMVGNDSGPKHLAALRGTRVVSLHTARLNWNEWGQEGDGLIISRRVPCAGCGIGPDPAECGRGFTCLTGITPDEVCDAVLELL
jgi:ADP-heptose:LPS heptosyltransferase